MHFISTIIIILLAILLIYAIVCFASNCRENLNSVIDIIRNFFKSSKTGGAKKKSMDSDDASADVVDMTGKTVHEMGFIDPKNCKLSYDIIEGKKTVEGRKKSDETSKLKAGDILVLHEKDVDITCKINFIHEHKNLTDYIKEEGVSAVTPCVKTAKESEDIYKTKFKVKEDEPIIGIGITPIKVEWKANVRKEHFDNIKKGSKTAEGRVNIGKWAVMKPGHFIKFKCANKECEDSGVPSKGKTKKGDKKTEKESLVKRVSAIHKYADFKAMLEKEGVEHVLPGMTIEEGLENVYGKIYPDAAYVKEHGVVSFGF